MHKGHLVGCGIGIAVALSFVAISEASVRSLGFLVATLACPLAMIIAMKFLMGGTKHGVHHHCESDLAAARLPTAKTEAELG